ncbi:AraC family transcriptional regulator [Listeria booriae]|uniref:helix-turn-helix domain-containing protein n=1 Tax=Listeria booriae TaxID=1552123 RepID=UPI0016260D2B|nr:AraC family transcriptional regulator [Listeria booriae]MBC1976073.1 AraC family transcriptional regulator [Listeria booriae]MBC2033635.1 AraC family transcriptional regulator [Listeria booriae]
MSIHELFFHIHYCNGGKYRQFRTLTRKMTRTLQHHELVLVTGGAGKYETEGKVLHFHEGMLFYIAPNVRHSLETSEASPASFLTVHFSYARVGFTDANWTIQPEPTLLSFPPVSTLHDYYPVSDTFEKLVANWHAKLPGYEFTSKTLLQQLLITIEENLRKQHKNYATSLKIEKVIDYMRQHLHTSVTLEELAALVQLSPTYLSRLFKETTGYPVIAFFNKIKMDRAKELMMDGTKKVKDLANQLGFHDEFYFSRLFKQQEGVSPTEYYHKNIHGF